jgi:hypothetical protein
VKQQKKKQKKKNKKKNKKKKKKKKNSTEKAVKVNCILGFSSGKSDQPYQH